MKLESDETQQALARISASLARSVRSASPNEWRQIVRNTIRRIDAVIDRLDKDRTEIGKKRGRRGPSKR